MIAMGVIDASGNMREAYFPIHIHDSAPVLTIEKIEQLNEIGDAFDRRYLWIRLRPDGVDGSVPRFDLSVSLDGVSWDQLTRDVVDQHPPEEPWHWEEGAGERWENFQAADSGRTTFVINLEQVKESLGTDLLPIKDGRASIYFRARAVDEAGNRSDPNVLKASLVVDDDASIRTIVSKSLEQLPFPVEIQSASNGLEGFEKVKSIRPDMVVLDIMMPGMDGFEVCQKLRSQVETAFIPVIMLTANPSEEGRIKGYLAGTDDYLAKPFNIAELHARVTRLLRRSYGIS